MGNLFLVCVSFFDMEYFIVDFSSVGYRKLLSLCCVSCEILGRVFGVWWKWVWGRRYGWILRGDEKIKSKLFLKCFDS